ncbi:MAG TPA: alpha-amylase family glycosyl hydrolase, partial [Clostridia bacterium]|nr:alpha-amylase family glycosyl hydrolase [Clostridia bacterium]
MNEGVNVLDWRLEWNPENGLPTSLTRRGKPGFTFPEPMMTFLIGGITPNNGRNQMYDVVGCDILGVSPQLTEVKLEKEIVYINTAFGPLHLKTGFEFKEDEVWLSFAVTNHSHRDIRLRSGVWRMSALNPMDFHRYSVIAPGYSPNMNEPYRVFKKIDEYREKEFIDLNCHGGAGTPGYRSGIIGVHGEGVGLVNWYLNETFSCHIESFGVEDDAVRWVRKIYCPCDLKPGETLVLDGLRMGIIEGTRGDAIRSASGDFSRFAKTPAGDSTPLRIMEICIGEKAGRSVFKGYDEVIKKLPEIADMGFNALQIMPAMPFPSYSTFDLMDIGITYGDEAELRNLAEKAHGLGLKIICDIVLHGPFEYEPEVVLRPVSPYLKDRKDWFMRHESGEPGRTYTRSLDLADPRYQIHVA